jgi:hypothetical protein
MTPLSHNGSLFDAHVRADDGRGDFWNDRIAVPAQTSHTRGYPMSQRECAGFNWPCFAVDTREPLRVRPEMSARCARRLHESVGWLYRPGCPGEMAVGVGQCACSCKSAPPARRACRRLFAPPVGVFGVAHPVNLEALVNVSGVPRCAPVDSESSARGVGQLAACAWIRRLAGSRFNSAGLTVACLASCTVGVPHVPIAISACCSSPGELLWPPPVRRPLLTLRAIARALLRLPPAIGLCHEPKSLPDMECPDARSAEIDRREGVTRAFHVSVNKVEPLKSLRNLFTKDDVRAALDDEVVPRRPKVPLVREPAAFACRAERLAGTGTRPDGPRRRPGREAERPRPSPDAREEMALDEACEVGRGNVDDRPVIDFAIGNLTGFHQRAEPRDGERIDFVVVGRH